jgi:circadian clock protein KaiC
MTESKNDVVKEILDDNKKRIKELVSASSKVNRIKTYVEGFDEQLGGGIPEGAVTLLCGMSGTMKSSIAFNILYNEVLNGKTAMYVSLEQPYYSLLSQMVSMGFDLMKVDIIVLSYLSDLLTTLDQVKNIKKGVLIIVDIGAIREELKRLRSTMPTSDWTNMFKNMIRKLQDTQLFQLFVLDSLSAFYTLSSFDHARKDLFHLFNFLRTSGLTSLLISEMSPDSKKYADYSVEDFLTDGIIYLNLERREHRVVREISVVKMRNTQCNTDIFVLNFDKGKFQALRNMEY